jgi:hypothetical protein
MYVCLLVCGVGIVAILVVYFFGRYLFRADFRGSWLEPSLRQEILNFLQQSRVRPNIPRYITTSYIEFLQRTNEFWGAYLQVLVAVLLIVLLTVLLLSKTVSAEAGLPILSAISGFAIARGVSGSRSITPPDDKEARPERTGTNRTEPTRPAQEATPEGRP